MITKWHNTVIYKTLLGNTCNNNTPEIMIHWIYGIILYNTHPHTGKKKKKFSWLPKFLADLVYDGLHVRLVFVVTIEKSGPLLGADTKTSVHGHLNDLTVMLTTKGLVCTKLQTHTQRERERECTLVMVWVQSHYITLCHSCHNVINYYWKLNRN